MQGPCGCTPSPLAGEGDTPQASGVRGLSEAENSLRRAGPEALHPLLLGFCARSALFSRILKSKADVQGQGTMQNNKLEGGKAEGRRRSVWRSALFVATALLSGCSEPRSTFQYVGKETRLLGPPGDGYKPLAGLVSTPDAAAGIAEAVADGIYGEAQIHEQRPYQVTDTQIHWIVRGNRPQPSVGGGFEIIINKRDGAILHVTHYQ